MVAQRNQRPLHVPPGFWKQQLPAKYLDIAGKGDVEALRQLIAQHPEFLNKRGNHNRTLLWEAARRGRLPAVQWLVSQGAELDTNGCYNNESRVQISPYCAAIYYHRAPVADYLRSQGARLDIFRAAFLGDISRVAGELDHNPGLLNAEDPSDFIYYMPLLAFAVAGRQPDLVDLLLKRGATVAPYSAQLLALAARSSSMDMFNLLVTHGADIQAVGADIFISIPDIHMIQYLLSHGASAWQPLENGFSPIIYLSRGDKGEHPEKIQLLLDHGAGVNAIGPKGRTALHYAAAAGFLRVMTLLLDHGADFTLRDAAGQTALSLAQRAGKTAAANLLAERGALS
jgi:ankyrin repeat protein